MPDWHTDNDLTPEDATTLTALDDLCVEDPVLYSLVLMNRTSRTIARHLVWPHDWVLHILRLRKKEGITHDYQGPNGVKWMIRDDQTELIALSLRVAEFRQKGGLCNPIEQERE